MSIQEALLSSIETMIQNTAADYIPQSDFECTIMGFNNGKYRVRINNADYYVYNAAGINLKIGMGVWVHVPNNNFAKAFIIGGRTNATSSGGTPTPSIDVMHGATATSDGSSGLVPTPHAGDNNRFLCGNGTWKDVAMPTEQYTSVMPSTGNNGDIVLLKY